MGLGLLFNTRRGRWLGFAAGMACGWTMGIYQMLKGAHFLSHTVTTMLLAILIIQIIEWCGTVGKAERDQRDQYEAIRSRNGL